MAELRRLDYLRGLCTTPSRCIATLFCVLQIQQMEWGVDDALKIIHIDINHEELGRFGEPTIGIAGDAKMVLNFLLEVLDGELCQAKDCPACSESRNHNWKALVAAQKEETERLVRGELAPQMEFIDAIREVLPEDGILVDELTQVALFQSVASTSATARHICRAPLILLLPLLLCALRYSARWDMLPGSCSPYTSLAPSSPPAIKAHSGGALQRR